MVVGAVAVDQLDPADREALAVEPPHDVEDLAGVPPVDDEPAAVDVAVESPVPKLDQSQLRDVDGAPGPPRAADDPLLDLAADRLHAAVERRRPRALPGSRRGRVDAAPGTGGEGNPCDRCGQPQHRSILGTRRPQFAD
jgi:hypothetical protein